MEQITEEQRTYLNSRFDNATEIIKVDNVKQRIKLQLNYSRDEMFKEIKRLCKDTIREIDSYDDEHLVMCLSEALRIAVYVDVTTYDMDKFKKLGGK